VIDLKKRDLQKQNESIKQVGIGIIHLSLLAGGVILRFLDKRFSQVIEELH